MTPNTPKGAGHTLAVAAYHDAYAAHGAAIKALVEATKAAFPIGTRVRSEQRYGVVVDGEVVGHDEYSDYGCVRVRNLKTGKTHRAYPFVRGDRNVFEVVS